jgi:Flp pilus assembly protein TadD
MRNNLGVMLYTAGRLPEAIAELEKTLELDPDFTEARNNLNRARQANVLPHKPQ